MLEKRFHLPCLSRRSICGEQHHSRFSLSNGGANGTRAEHQHTRPSGEAESLKEIASTPLHPRPRCRHRPPKAP